MTVQIYNAELARLLGPSAAITQPTLANIINQGATYLNDLYDVVLINPTYGQYLRNNTYFGNTYWMNTDVSQLAIDLLGTGTFTPTDPTLVALAAYNSNGLVTQTAADTFTGRTLIPPAAGFTITNPAGIAGNPTFVLSDDLLALEGLGSTGFATRTAANTWAQRTLTEPAAGLTISNPAGIAGNPTFTLANDLSGLEGLASTGFAARTGTDTWAVRTLTEGNNIDITNPAGVAGDPTITAVPSGSDTHIQYNNGGSFGGESRFFFDDGADARVTIFDTPVDQVLFRALPGLEFRTGNVADGQTIFPGILWTSSDSSFTTENPKLVAAITASATELYSANTDGGAAINFYATEDNPGATNLPNLVLQVNSSGIGITGRISVDQNSTTLALPVLELAQDDVSEEFIRFIGSSANAVLTQSLVEDADITTATRVGWFKIYIQDDGNQMTDQAYFVPFFTLA